MSFQILCEMKVFDQQMNPKYFPDPTNGRLNKILNFSLKFLINIVFSGFQI